MDPSLLSVIAEARRQRILQLIWDRELTAGEIAEHFPISFAAVSQHLGRLREAGLVSVRQEGRYRFYRARKDDLGTLAAFLEASWRDRLTELKRMAEEGPGPEREEPE